MLLGIVTQHNAFVEGESSSNLVQLLLPELSAVAIASPGIASRGRETIDFMRLAAVQSVQVPEEQATKKLWVYFITCSSSALSAFPTLRTSCVSIMRGSFYFYLSYLSSV